MGGWAEGYGAANHATQLCLDEETMRIGVGSAISANGTVYTCIIGMGKIMKTKYKNVCKA